MAEYDWEGFFKAWDKDGSGSLELKELVSMMTEKPLEMPKEEAEKNAEVSSRHPARDSHVTHAVRNDMPYHSVVY